MERILPYEAALAEVLAYASALPAPATRETVPLAEATHRTLATPIQAPRDQPPFARSTRDGFAVHAADTQTPAQPLKIQGLIRAGEHWTGAPLAPGHVLEIMTGAPVPPGADAVLMIEHTEPTAGHITPTRTLSPGDNIVPTGAEAAAGASLVPTGRHLGVAEIGLAASCGLPHLDVFARPTVAIIATGDELVEVGTAPEPWQITNSNSYSMAALVAGEGALAQRLPIARDTREALQARLREALTADLILFSGGVSMGKYDLVETVLAEAGAQFHFTGARIQPGKPIVFGDLTTPGTARKPFFGLPGNPISTEVCFRLFVAPLLRALAGRTDRAPRFAEARLAEDVRGGAPVTRFLPALIESNWQAVTVRPVPWQGSGDLAANARANGFVVLPAATPHVPAGDPVRILLR